MSVLINLCWFILNYNDRRKTTNVLKILKKGLKMSQIKTAIVKNENWNLNSFRARADFIKTVILQYEF
jgi:hypothetical protein